MPRYLFETDVDARSQLDAAGRLAAQRFPEITIEHRYTTHDDTGARVLWVCRAPTEVHLGRWAAAAHLALTCIRRVAADAPPTSPVDPTVASNPKETR